MTNSDSINISRSNANWRMLESDVRDALEGDSNDAEHAALVAVADFLDIRYVADLADMDPTELRAEAERVVGEDRVPVEALRELIQTYGR